MKNARKEQKELLELFCALIAPYVRPGAEETLRACLTHKEGRKFDALVCHGDLSKLFALREVKRLIPEEAPCLCGINTREKLPWAEAEKELMWNDSGLALALDGSWMAIRQELDELRIYVPNEKKACCERGECV